MRCSRERPVLFLLHFVFPLAAAGHAELHDSGGLFSLFAEQGQLSQRDVSTVHPVKAAADGAFLSHSLAHHFEGGRARRDLRPLGPEEERVYYKVDHGGRSLTFNLTANERLLSSAYVLERRNGNGNGTAGGSEHRRPGGSSSCHLLGTVEAPGVRGTAAISTCQGLRGFFSLPEGHYFIEPAQKSPDGPAGPAEPHVVYPRVPTGRERNKRSAEAKETPPGPCGVQDAPSDSVQVEREREQWEREQQRWEEDREEDRAQDRRRRRSVSRERWVETMVVADAKLIEYHGSENVESYIFTIMNMVAGIFHDASIGNAIHVILVRLILLQGDEKGLKIVHHADTTLSSFCAWQKNLNPQSDTHPAHHDVAVLVTRKDICAGRNQPCETLGLSHLSGMCQPHRSCNINEDSGLPVAFTVAHELGHSFGIHHDGQGNDCELEGKHPFIMSRQLMYDSSPLTWSSCSKEYITRFLDRGWGFCLDDRPSKRDLTTPLARLGVRYTTHHQCQLQYGPNATFCHEVDNMCQILWCSVNGSCRSKLDSPIDGTRCGPEKWCISGECVIVGKLPETVNGGWGQWSAWSHCSRTCGTGVQSAERECSNPKPEFGGKYCTGERKRYRTCNTKPCQQDTPSFREMLCSEFDTVAYHNELYQWIPVANPMSPCELHCRPVVEYFSERMLDAVTDGTPCFMNNVSRNICVNGVCKAVGCDYGIDSNAEEDRCGVCLGDGTSCETVYRSFDDGGDGFGYVDVGVIPEGARDILVKEVEEAGNFLALRNATSEDYFLNGNFIIQWNGEYEAGGTTFYYERSGNMENLTAPGPTKGPVMLQLLFQEKNLGIKYEYSIKKTKETGNEVIEPLYRWRHGAWTDCSTTCGLGEQHQPVRCFEVDVGVVDESLCDAAGRPEDRHRKCKNMDCPARWWVGGWQHCAVTCGSEGVRKRTVLCVRTVSGEERVLHPVECKHLLKPKPVVPCNRDVPCGQDWAVGNWEECPVTCGGAVRSRTVTCALTPKKPCDASTKPRSRSLCALQSCPNSSLRRRPGPAPKYRRTYPPKSQPTKNPEATWAPTARGVATTTPTTAPTVTVRTKTTAEGTTTAFTPTTTSLSTPTIPGIVDADDYELNVVGMNEDESVFPSKVTPAGKDRKATDVEKVEEGEEEGSTPNVMMYTPGYDYVVEERTTEEEEEEGIIDLDVVTSTSLKNPLESTTPTPQIVITPTLLTSPPTLHTTKAATAAYSTPNGSTKTWARTTRRYPSSNPHTTPRIDPYSLRTQRVTLTTPMHRRSVTSKAGIRTTRAPPPSTTAWKPFTTAASPQCTVTIVKLRKPAATPKKNGPTPRAKKPSSWPKGSRSNGQSQRPESPMSSAVSDQSNLMAREPVSMDVFWVVGNWSECSTTCGIGAIWRTVVCSSQEDDDCASLKRPEPARTCILQPCATWHSGSWSKCPDSCAAAVGRRYREVQCVDSQSERPLRPFHCQAASSRPLSTLTCPHKPCMAWSASPWGPCSGSCGEGVRERLVYCPEPHRCSATLRPNSTEACGLKPCTHWAAEDWEECSVSCGGGQQQRDVDCVSERDFAAMPNSLCEKISKPETLRKCNAQQCKTNAGPVCRKNTMSSRFCDKLKLLGRCSLRSVHRQCCVTCGS